MANMALPFLPTPSPSPPIPLSTSTSSSFLPQAPSAISCSTCYFGFPLLSISGRTLTEHQLTQGLLGLIVQLPHRDTIPAQSCAHQQDALNDKAYNHPAVIIRTSPCGHLVQCLPVTSFGKSTIRQKYHRAHNNDTRNDIFSEYLALKRRDTVPHNQLGELDHTGPEMPQQSYVHLDCAYWIEWQLLAPFKPRDPSRRLYPASLRIVISRFEYTTQKNIACRRRLDRLTSPPRTPARTPSPRASPPRTPSPRMPRDMSGPWRRQAPPAPLPVNLENREPIFRIPSPTNRAVPIMTPPPTPATSSNAPPTASTTTTTTAHKRKGSDQSITRMPSSKKQR